MFVFSVHAILLVLVALSPFSAFERMGGAGMFEELSFTRLDHRELGRIVLWGSCRRALLPALLVLWITAALSGTALPRARIAIQPLLEFWALHCLGWVLVFRHGIRLPFTMRLFQFILALGLAASHFGPRAVQAIAWSVLLIYLLVNYAGEGVNALLSGARRHPLRAVAGLAGIAPVVGGLYLASRLAAPTFDRTGGEGLMATLGIMAAVALLLQALFALRWHLWFRQAIHVD